MELGNARDTARIARDLAQAAQLGVARGLTAGQDDARLEADVASADAEVLRLEAELRAAKRLLLILVGDPAVATDDLALAADLSAPPAIPQVTPAILLDRRPDVEAAQLQLQVAAQTIRIDRLALFPRVTIQPGAALSAVAGGTGGLWSLVAGLTVPVLDRARLLATLRISEARGNQAVIGYERAVQTAFGEAETALVRVEAGRRRIERLERATEQARLGFDGAHLGYTAGITDITTLLQAERIWLQNRSALAAGRFALLADTGTAIRALGGGWDETIVPGALPGAVGGTGS